MADLSTSYMGMKLSSPVVVGASTFSNKVDNIKKAEDMGAGALVIYSLFQEQIEMEALELKDELAISSDHFAESLTYFPQTLEHSGSREHIMWTEKTRKEVSFPLIGSLNARSMGSWLEYAKQLQNAGCNALELNVYSVETDPNVTAEDIEKRTLEIISAVKAEVSIPVAVKLSPFYSSLPNFAKRVVEAGADSLVLFNRFYQPIIDPDKEELDFKLELSTPQETRLPLRWIAILAGRIGVDLAASTGIHSAKEVAMHLLAGASVTQVVSALYMNGLEHITTINNDLAQWMDEKGYDTIDEFRGVLSQKNVPDPYAFERAQYIYLLLGLHSKEAKYGIVQGYYPVPGKPGRSHTIGG